MTRLTTELDIKLTITPEDRRIAMLAAAAVGLSIAEAAIPLPLPGIKPGLANIVTLLVLYRYGWKTAAWVSLLRIVASAMALGTFLTPTFVMSLTGGIASLTMLSVCVKLPSAWVSAVGLSVLAAFVHIGTQLLVVDLWLMPGVSLAGVLPFFLAAAWLSGLVNGLIVARIASTPACSSGQESVA